MFDFPTFGKGGKAGGPGIMESLKAIGEVAELLTDIRDELRSLNGNLERYNSDRQEHEAPRTVNA